MTPEIRKHIREAVAHQLRAWDSAGAAEKLIQGILDEDVELHMDLITKLAAGIDDPKDVGLLTDTMIDDDLNYGNGLTDGLGNTVKRKS